MKTSPQELQDLQTFLSKWRRALRSENRLELYWEGQRAVDELRRRRYLNRAQLLEFVRGDKEREEHWNAKKAIGHVCTELKVYERHIGGIRQALKRENSVKKELAKQSDAWRLMAESMKLQSPLVAAAIAKLARQLKGTVWVIEYFQEKRWRYPEAVAGVKFAKKLPSYLTQDRGQAAGVKFDKKSSSVLIQERELDGRFQVRLAKVIRLYLPLRQRYFPKNITEQAGISLRTIARLIVLFLVCAELAEHKDDQVKLKHNGTVVSVNSLVQKLRRDGLK